MTLVKTVEIVSSPVVPPGYSLIRGVVKSPPIEQGYSGRVFSPVGPAPASARPPTIEKTLHVLTTYRDTSSGWSHHARSPVTDHSHPAVKAAHIHGVALVGRREEPITEQELDDALHPESAAHRAALKQAEAQVEKDKENT